MILESGVTDSPGLHMPQGAQGSLLNPQATHSKKGLLVPTSLTV